MVIKVILLITILIYLIGLYNFRSDRIFGRYMVITLVLIVYLDLFGHSL